ncbi:MAG: hypothetical protein KBD63_05280 [Bacteriovoracaceae bacterium]|nr:hypothetical protein [Bacteriovoracaceae bacterium]
MDIVKKADKYTVMKKSSGRYAVKNSSGKWINGQEKVTILVTEGLVKLPKAKAKPVVEAPSAEETPSA